MNTQWSLNILFHIIECYRYRSGSEGGHLHGGPTGQPFYFFCYFTISLHIQRLSLSLFFFFLSLAQVWILL